MARVGLGMLVALKQADAEGGPRSRRTTRLLTLEYTPGFMLKIRMNGPQSLRIGQVARKTGLTVDAIRFYERAGLLPRPMRTSGGYRLYNPPAVADLEFIQKAQQLGFSLSEIRELSSIQRHPQEVCAHVRDLIAQKLETVRTKIAELQTLEVGLIDALRHCVRALRRHSTHRESCPVLAEIANRPGSKSL